MKKTKADQNKQTDNSNPPNKRSGIFGLFFRSQSQTKPLNSNDSNQNNIQNMHIDPTINHDPAFKVLSKFYRDPEYSKRCETHLNTLMTRQFQTCEFDKKSFGKLFDEVLKLVEHKKDLEIKKAIIVNLEKELENEKQSVALEKRRYDELEHRLQEEINKLKDSVAVYQNKNVELVKNINDIDQERVKYKDDNLELSKNIKSLETTVSNQRNEINKIVGELQALKCEYKKALSLIPKDSIMIKEKDNVEHITISSFNIVFTDKKLCQYIAGYLPAEEILNTRIINKAVNNTVMTNLMDFVRVTANEIKKRNDKEKKELWEKINFFKSRAEQAPEEYAKHTFTKYIWLKQIPGDYMGLVLNQAENFCSFVNEITDKDENKDQKSFMKYLGVGNDKKEEKKDSIIQKIFADTSKNLPALSLNAPGKQPVTRNIFIPSDAFKNSNDDKTKVMQTANSYVEELIKVFYKLSNNLSAQKDTQNQFFNIFAKLLIFSKLLLQECKELEYLKDYLVHKYEEAKDKITKSDSVLQQYNAILEQERKIRAAITEKYQELEKKMVSLSNGQSLKESHLVKELEHKIYQMEVDLEASHTDKQNLEAKIKILIKEIKTLRTKNKEMEDTTTGFCTEFTELKNVFDSLKLDV
jgi:hypothetical protein